MNDSDVRDPVEGAAQWPIQDWLERSSAEELREGVLYLQRDARGAYASAAKYRDTPGQEWIAVRVQAAAAHSASFARAGHDKLRIIEAQLPIEISQPGDCP